jgi:penicillin amidase
MRRFGLAFPLVLGCAWTNGCDDDPTPPGPDAGIDGAGTIEDLAVARELTLPELGGEVDVVRDERGMWHVYAQTMEDAVRVEGYLMARDRMGQMEFVRRFATGRLAEFAASLQPSLIDDDRWARFLGHARNAAAIYAAMTPANKALLDAYVEGINFFIARLRNDEEFFPRGVDSVLLVDFIEDWTAIDTISIARFEAAHLSHEAETDVAMTEALAAFEAAYPEGSADARIAARRDAFHDLFPLKPGQPVWVRDGLPNVDADTGTRALVTSCASPIPSPAAWLSAWPQL